MKSRDSRQLQWLVENKYKLQLLETGLLNIRSGKKENLFRDRETDKYYIVRYDGYGFLETLIDIEEISQEKATEMKAANYWDKISYEDVIGYVKE